MILYLQQGKPQKRGFPPHPVVRVQMPIAITISLKNLVTVQQSEIQKIRLLCGNKQCDIFLNWSLFVCFLSVNSHQKLHPQIHFTVHLWWEALLIFWTSRLLGWTQCVLFAFNCLSALCREGSRMPEAYHNSSHLHCYFNWNSSAQFGLR